MGVPSPNPIKDPVTGLTIVRWYTIDDPVYADVDNRPLSDIVQRDNDIVTKVSTWIDNTDSKIGENKTVAQAPGSVPAYTSHNYITDGMTHKAAISALDASIGSDAGSIDNIAAKVGENKSTPASATIPDYGTPALITNGTSHNTALRTIDSAVSQWASNTDSKIGEDKWVPQTPGSVPAYTSHNYITDGMTHKAAISALDSSISNLVHIGSIMIWPLQPSIPAGYLECNGSAISRITYIALYSVIGTQFGLGDGVNTFNLPDLRGVFVRGWDGGRGLDPGRTFGSYQADSLASHAHTYQTLATASLWLGDGSDWGYTDFSSTTSGYTGSTETRPKNVTMLYIIKY